jgi:predicted RNA-binding Zn-ribbon protein involved in translation (DUF1610 family)
VARRVKRSYIVGGVAFVAHPAAAGLWVKTDTSVVKTACPACGATIHAPCRRARSGAWSGATHYLRRRAARTVPLPVATMIVYYT